jgi:hypothetical protein
MRTETAIVTEGKSEILERKIATVMLFITRAGNRLK